MVRDADLPLLRLDLATIDPDQRAEMQGLLSEMEQSLLTTMHDLERLRAAQQDAPLQAPSPAPGSSPSGVGPTIVGSSSASSSLGTSLTAPAQDEGPGAITQDEDDYEEENDWEFRVGDQYDDAEDELRGDIVSSRPGVGEFVGGGSQDVVATAVLSGGFRGDSLVEDSHEDNEVAAAVLSGLSSAHFVDMRLARSASGDGNSTSSRSLHDDENSEVPDTNPVGREMEMRLREFFLQTLEELAGDRILTLAVGARMKDHVGSNKRTDMTWMFEVPCIYVNGLAPVTKWKSKRHGRRGRRGGRHSQKDPERIRGEPRRRTVGAVLRFAKTGKWLKLEMLGKTVEQCAEAWLYKYGVTGKGAKYRAWQFDTTLRDLEFPEKELKCTLEYLFLNLPPALVERLIGEQLFRNNLGNNNRRIIWHGTLDMDPQTRSSNRTELRELLIDDGNTKAQIWESMMQTVVDMGSEYGVDVLSEEESEAILMELQILMSGERLRIIEEMDQRKVQRALEGVPADQLEEARRKAEQMKRTRTRVRAWNAVKNGQMTAAEYDEFIQSEATRHRELRIENDRARIMAEVPEGEREQALAELERREAKNTRKRNARKRQREPGSDEAESEGVQRTGTQTSTRRSARLRQQAMRSNA